jgi:hypothetical protein
MNDFVASLNDTMRRLHIEPENVFNIDETNVDFSIDARTTLNVQGAQTVNVRAAKSSGRCTALLGCSLTGEKLPPFVIFKGKRGGRSRIMSEFTNLPYPPFLRCTVQPKAWIDEEGMLEWVNRVWAPRVLDRGPTILILDEFSAHMTGPVLDAFALCGTHLDFIPAGYTSKLQPCDVGLNKPFKDNCRVEYEKFMVTAGENDKPTRLIVSGWIDNAWQAISATTIVNTWRKIGIGGRDGEPDFVGIRLAF